ncbi:MAG TPA: TRZ/ATZ family protein [Firmicutes bacterium]|nr:TRZ/ATZ family protein [Bacillota bacterium]
MKKIQTPLTKKELESLKSGDEVLISGIIYTMRDAAHAKVSRMIEENKKLPFPLENSIIYYCGPTPAKPGHIIGSCGPTTASRMDKYTPLLLEHGLAGMIGKGGRNSEVKNSIKKHKAVYFSALGGLGAEYAKNVTGSKVIAFEEMGPEAVYELEVKDFYAVVINDPEGNDFYSSESRS